MKPGDLATPVPAPPPWTATSLGRTEEVRRLLAEGADVQDIGEEGSSLLHAAAAEANEDVLRLLLLQQGSDVLAKDNRGATPLHFAAHAGSETSSIVLLEHGADASASDNTGMTPLHYA
ncbi:ankyrin repeat-containing domain protein, partial [Baffinella frigidus]